MIPINNNGGLFLDQKVAYSYGEKLSGAYAFAEPFPHVIIDNFLPAELAEEILANFPEKITNDEVAFQGNYFEHNKRQIFPHSCNQKALSYFLFFNSAPFLQYLEGLTGITGLISDPYYFGGGFHEISRGGKLGVHADFRINEKLHLNRRINVLIYLNKNWKNEYGGELELWDQTMNKKVKSIAPLFNRCVIFNTDQKSYHGHPDSLKTPLGITRKSLALYYYTASSSIYNEVTNTGTDFQARNIQELSKVKRFNRFNFFNRLALELLPPIITKMIKKARINNKKI